VDGITAIHPSQNRACEFPGTRLKPFKSLVIRPGANCLDDTRLKPINRSITTLWLICRGTLKLEREILSKATATNGAVDPQLGCAVGA
jgi:hypothetical protein